MYIDRNEFLDVARVVIKHNPYLTGSSPEWLADRMEANAYLHLCDKPGYIGTHGYVLSSYQCHDGSWGIKASVSHTLF